MKTNEIIEAITSGRQFEYLSYNYQEAKSELLKLNKAINDECDYWSDIELAEIMPVSFKNKYPEWKKGNIWEIKLNRYGQIRSVSIGKNPKYAKSIGCYEFEEKLRII